MPPTMNTRPMPYGAFPYLGQDGLLDWVLPEAGKFLKSNGPGQRPTLATAGGVGSGDVIGDDVVTVVQNLVAYASADGKHITEFLGALGEGIYHNGTSWKRSHFYYLENETAGQLQALIDSLTTGGIIILGPGSHEGFDIDFGGITVAGVSNSTACIITGAISVSKANTTLKDMLCRPGAVPYAIRFLHDGGAGSLSNNRLENVHVTNEGGANPVDGLILDGAIITRVTDCLFAFCTGNGASLLRSDPDPGTIFTQFIKSRFVFNNRGCMVDDCTQVHFDGCQFEANSVATNGSELWMVDCESCFVECCYFETHSSINTQIQIDASSSCHIHGCFINLGTPPNEALRSVLMQTASSCSVTNNRFAVGDASQTDLIIFDSNCVDCEEDRNWMEHDGWVTRYDPITPSRIPRTSVVTVEKDLGGPAQSGAFTITVEACTANAPAFVRQAAGPYTGKGDRFDEAEMDFIECVAKVRNATTIDVFWHSDTIVRGNFKFDFQIRGR